MQLPVYRHTKTRRMRKNKTYDTRRHYWLPVTRMMGFYAGLRYVILPVLFWVTCLYAATAQRHAMITVNANQPGVRVSPMLHGIFFEEISHAGEGGLYAELVQNRGFEEANLPPGTTLVDSFIVPPRTPHFSLTPPRAGDWKMEWPVKSQWPAWSAQVSGRAKMQLALTTSHPLNQATPHSLQVTIQQKAPQEQCSVVNEGFWGMHIVKGEDYHLRLYARTANTYKGPVTASLQAEDGSLLATHTWNNMQAATWKQFSCTLHAGGTAAKAKLVLSFGSTGTLWLDFVSLFPANTFKQRPNGMRADLAQLLANLKPAFIRWPGGCFVEGITIQSAPDWKKTIGPVEQRPGTYSPWGYWSSDGLGYHEYLQFCEDIGAKALYVFNAGVSCDYRSGTFITDDSLAPVIQNALDAIEYAIGPVHSKWGRLRAANGHPAPFPLQYVEVGNEQHGPRYARRYNRFYDAIKKKYPGIQVVASMGIGDVNNHTLDSMHKVDIADEHAYKAAYWSMRNYDHFDRYKRGKWDLYVGEYATNSGVGNGNLTAALSDAVYILSMERNGDLVKMSSYAPLLVNVNDVDWPVNLIHFDAARSFGRMAYYTVKMMNENRADLNWATGVEMKQKQTAAPLFAGGIGLSTWDTQTEYKDIEVIQEGKTVYRSDFIHKPEEWQLVRGNWQVADSSLFQQGPGAQQLAILKNRQFSTYTLRLKARKKDGLNAFIVPFAVKDASTCLRAHIGSWYNSHCVFESVTQGDEVTDLTNQQKLPQPIEQGRWYDIRLEVDSARVACYLDNELLMTLQEPQKFFAIAGKDERKEELVIKAVNAYTDTLKATVRLNGMHLPAGQTATWITLTAPSASAENSFEQPTAFVPQTREIQWPAGDEPELVLQPGSINIIRLKLGK